MSEKHCGDSNAEYALPAVRQSLSSFTVLVKNRTPCGAVAYICYPKGYQFYATSYKYYNFKLKYTVPEGQPRN